MRLEPRGGKLLQLRHERASFVEKLVGLVAAHPGFERCDVGGLLAEIGERNLVGSPEAFRLEPVHFLGTRPSLRASQHDHGPARDPMSELRFRADRLIARMSPSTLSSTDAICRCIEAGS